MFKSYEFIQNLKYNDIANEHCWEYKIIDDDFEHIGFGYMSDYEVRMKVKRVLPTSKSGAQVMPTFRRSALEISIAAITTYSQRKNANVAANLVKAFQWYIQKYNVATMNEMVDWNKKHNPLYTTYEKDVEKYLLLL